MDPRPPPPLQQPKRCLIPAFLAYLALLLAQPTWAESPDRLVRVMGSGSVTLQPDTAAIQIGVTARGDDVLAVQSQTNAEVSSILSALRSLGLTEGDVAATDVRISPRYRYDKAQQQSVADGFEVSRDLQITLRDLSQLAVVMSEVVKLGANSVSPPRLSSSKYETSYRDALELAVKQAKDRAEVLATASGAQLGDVISIDAEQFGNRPEPIALRAMAADSAESSYQVGDLTARASVTVTFGLD